LAAPVERLTLRDLFSLQVDMVFYDLTSTYFEGQGPPNTGAHGHSRDGEPRNPQVLVGLVLVDGWPIAHHEFNGNWCDAKTSMPQWPRARRRSPEPRATGGDIGSSLGFDLFTALDAAFDSS
jgi:hypothetical protein